MKSPKHYKKQAITNLPFQKSFSPSKLNIVNSNPQTILMQEIKKAKTLLEKAKLENSNTFHKSNRNSIKQLRNIEAIIRSKDWMLKNIQHEIKALRNGRQVNHDKVRGIGQEIKNVIQLRKELKTKKQNLSVKLNEISKTQQRYISKCQKQNINPLNFQAFKESQKARMKSERTNLNDKKQPSKILNEANLKKWENQNYNKKSQFENKTIKECLVRRNVAEAALKTQRKKHKQEIGNLLNKLDFLQGEDEEMDNKIESKHTQLENAQTKFCQSRKYVSNSQKSLKKSSFKISY